MNKTGECPKCHEFQAVRVPEAVNNLRVPVGGIASVPVVLYVCCACGYVEQWIDEAQDLAKVAKLYGDES